MPTAGEPRGGSKRALRRKAGFSGAEGGGGMEGREATEGAAVGATG